MARDSGQPVHDSCIQYTFVLFTSRRHQIESLAYRIVHASYITIHTVKPSKAIVDCHVTCFMQYLINVTFHPIVLGSRAGPSESKSALTLVASSGAARALRPVE